MKQLYSAVFPADLEQIPGCVREILENRFIADLCERDILSRFDFSLMLYEAFNNAVIHGCCCDTSKQVKVRVSGDDAEVQVKISDDGNGFDYGHYDDGIIPASDVVCGRGILLLKSLASEFHYCGNGNTLVFTRQLRPKAIS